MHGGDLTKWKQKKIFKPELGRFVLSLSVQRNALNPCEDFTAVARVLWRWEHANSAGCCRDGAPLWQMCLTTDSSNHERWQCCGRRQFLQMVKNIPNLTSTCMCCKPTLHIEKQLNWLKQVVKVRLVYVHKTLLSQATVCPLLPVSEPGHRWCYSQ